MVNEAVTATVVREPEQGNRFKLLHHDNLGCDISAPTLEDMIEAAVQITQQITGSVISSQDREKALRALQARVGEEAITFNPVKWRFEDELVRPGKPTRPRHIAVYLGEACQDDKALQTRFGITAKKTIYQMNHPQPSAPTPVT